ncbi:MAG: DUF4390 domain-containing protein [Proteobacteria bacterium]|nr:DUF4390 domain-containing protein [Pseudomonadota bacterium]
MRGTLSKLAVVLALLLGAQAASADDIEIRDARLEQTEEGLALNADFGFDFNARLEQAVTNGVPLYFVVEFELTQPRWYWFDEKTATKRLQTRLSYHALSRHFRLSTGLLQQNYASLSEALAVLRRVRGWHVMDKSVPLADTTYQAAVRMRLDLALLPKPFQVNALTSREWHLDSDWRRFTWRPASPASPAPAAPAEKRDEGPAR